MADGSSPTATAADQRSREKGSGNDIMHTLRTQPHLLCEERHDAGDEGELLQQGGAGGGAGGAIACRWRQKEKLKTTGVALVLCLNIGVDPPDVIKISPCARLECWVDPLSMQPAKALETIGKNLQAQYERWQPRAKYKMHLDPTVEDVKKLCLSCRRNAKNERVLFHYNGHGVPRPTVNGEIWVFNSRYTQYIPLSIYELQSWLGTPCIYVLDCSAAGVIINSFRAFMQQQQQDAQRLGGGAAGAGAGAALPGGASAAGGPGAGGASSGSDPLKEVIVLAACGANELLPQNPELPADVFTACCTTPIKVALRWFCSRSLLRNDGITKELIDRIPGRQTDRKTPLGELNWIFTAITDTIAWNVLPRPLFQKLFRSDLLVASLFRNYLLAERIMSAAGATPVSYPRLPPTSQHPMWQAWDMAAEMCLLQLPTLLADPNAEFKPSSFFSQQLTAFELWLQHGSKERQPPEQLPIVLQVLLSQVHRLRALLLLGRFLDMGPWAVDLALSVGIFPYVLKLLQTSSAELRTTLVFIWCKILALDPACQADLVKDGGHAYFNRYLASLEPGVEVHSRAQAAFVLATICGQGGPKGQALCAAGGMLACCLQWVRSLLPSLLSPSHALLVRWLCLALGKLCCDTNDISASAIADDAPDVLGGLLLTASPEIRAAAVFALGCLLHTPLEGAAQPTAAAAAGGGAAPSGAEPVQPGGPESSGGAGSAGPAVSPGRLGAEQVIAAHLLKVVYDASVLVRAEVAVALARLVRGHALQFQAALAAQQVKVRDFVRSAAPGAAAAGPRSAAAAGAQGEQPRGASGPPTSSGSMEVGMSILLQQRAASFHGHTPSSPPGSLAGPAAAAAAAAAQIAEAADAASQPGSGPQADEGAAAVATAAAAASNSGGGGDVYPYLVEAVLLLATDPSPKVARLGKHVLRLVQCEVTPVPGGGQAAAGAAGHQAGSSQASAITSPTHAASSHAGGGHTSFSQKLKPSNWRATFGSGKAAKDAGGSSQLPSASSSPPHSPPPEHPLAFGRPPYVLKAAAAAAAGPGGSAPAAQGRRSSASGSGGGGNAFFAEYADAVQELRSSASSPHGSSSAANALASRLGSASLLNLTADLPQSLIYKLSSEYFSRPLLEPAASAWRAEAEAATRYPWMVPPEPARKAQRLREMEAGVSRCRALAYPRLREQVFSLELGTESVHALCLHPYHPLLCTADHKGFLRISNYTDAACINAFHVTSGAPLSADAAHAPPTSVVYMRPLNEADGPLLLAASVDGAVRIWRSFTLPSTQRLATAWQAVPIHQPPIPLSAPATFDWTPRLGALFAAGGSHPDVVHRWDLHCELCVQQLPVGSAATAAGNAAGNGGVVQVERLQVAQSDVNQLLASCSDSTLRLFDVRTSRGPALTLTPFKGASAGVVFEPAGKPGVVVAGSAAGKLVFMDVRLGSGGGGDGCEPGGVGGGRSGVVRTVDAHSKGSMTCVVGHPAAPLLATATSSQVVKVWTDGGEAVGAIRLQASASTRSRAGAVTCMAFHPYQLLLAAAGADSVASLYCIDNSSGHSGLLSGGGSSLARVSPQ